MRRGKPLLVASKRKQEKTRRGFPSSSFQNRKEKDEGEAPPRFRTQREDEEEGNPPRRRLKTKRKKRGRGSPSSSLRNENEREDEEGNPPPLRFKTKRNEGGIPPRCLKREKKTRGKPLLVVWNTDLLSCPSPSSLWLRRPTLFTSPCAGAVTSCRPSVPPSCRRRCWLLWLWSTSTGWSGGGVCKMCVWWWVIKTTKFNFPPWMRAEPWEKGLVISTQSSQ